MPIDGSGKGFYIHEDHRRENAFVETYRIMPYSSFDDEESLKIGFTQFYRECRQAMVRGAQVEQILGDPMLDVSGFVHSENLPASHPFSKWAVMFTLNSFGRCSWELQLATAYFSFHLMRVCTILQPQREQIKTDKPYHCVVDGIPIGREL